MSRHLKFELTKDGIPIRINIRKTAKRQHFKAIVEQPSGTLVTEYIINKDNQPEYFEGTRLKEDLELVIKQHIKVYWPHTKEIKSNEDDYEGYDEDSSVFFQ